MNGDAERDMDDAWRAYLSERDELKKQGLGYGWNPQQIFASGWKAAETRSSGWYSGRE
jgi:hypothetical protein